MRLYRFAYLIFQERWFPCRWFFIMTTSYIRLSACSQILTSATSFTNNYKTPVICYALKADNL